MLYNTNVQFVQSVDLEQFVYKLVDRLKTF